MRRVTTTAATLALTAAFVAMGAGIFLRAQLPQAVGEWAPMAALPDPRTGASAVTFDNGLTLILGGRLANGAATASVVAFDPASNGTMIVGHLTAARVHAAATLLPGDRVLVTGGSIDGMPTADAEIFDLASGMSTPAGSMAQPRARHASTRLADETVLIVGGTTTGGAALARIEMFDPATGTFTTVGSLDDPRIGASATTLLDGRVLVAGGSDGVMELDTAEIYDPFWSTIEPVPTRMSVGRAGHTATLLPHNGSVLMAGGTVAGSATAASDLFLPAIFPDPISYGMGEFAPTHAMGLPRADAAGGSFGEDGYAFVAGGGSSNAEKYRFATIKTDRDDYAPGERAVITGSGWKPGEPVTLLFQEDPAVHDDYVLTVMADAAGNIYWDQWAPDQHDLGVRFYLTAQDSRSRAQMTFTDSQPQTLAVADPTSATVTQGSTAAYGMVTMRKVGNNNPCTITLLVTSGLPAGATAVFGTNPLVMTTDDVSTTLSVTTGTTTPSGTYSFAVIARRAMLCQGSGDLTSNPLTLTVTQGSVATTTTPANATATYGDASVGLSASVTDTAVVNSGTMLFTVRQGATVIGVPTSGAVSGGNASVTYLLPAGTPAGNYVIEASYSGADGFNPSGGLSTLSVNRADATVSVNGFTGVYDGTAHGATGTATGVGGVDLSALLDLGASFTNVPGGTAHWTFNAGYANNNYNTAASSVDIVITRADATVSVNGYTGTYDGAAHGATGTATGVGGVDLSALLDLGASFTNVPGGTAHWTFNAGYANNNYNTAASSVDIVITRADATVSVNGYTGTYDGAAHGATGTATGVGGVDLSALLDLGASFTDVPGGTAHWTFNAGYANNNYNTAASSVDIVINRADAAISVSGYTGVYDAIAHGASGSATGVGGVDLSALLDRGASFTNVPGGTAHWTFNAGYANNNYNTAASSVDIVITRADATVSVNGYTGTYDGAAHGATGTATGVGGVGLSALFDLGASFADVPGGTANWTFNAGYANNNYNTASGSVDIVITRADATISVTGYTGTYYGTAYGASGSATGVGGTNLSALLDLGASFTDVPGGTATWTFNAGYANNNYNTASGNVAVVINPKPLTVSGIVAANKPFDGTTAATLDVSAAALVGIVPGDTVLLHTGAAIGTFASASVGAHTVTISGLTISGADVGNYALTQPTAVASITAWHLSGFHQPVGIVNTYTGAAPAVSASTRWNTVKGGQTVPLKFNLFAAVGGIELTSVADVLGFALVSLPCTPGYEDPIDADFTTTGATVFRYADGQFIQNWQTPKGANRCYRVTMTARDGSQLHAFFKTK